jgi:hypothetical protein
MRATGRASVSTTNPRAFGICDRCGFLYNHHELQWQFDYRGAALINIRLLVCETCLDVPQNQLRNIIVPADPTPIMNARTEDYPTASTDFFSTVDNFRQISSASWTGSVVTLTLAGPLTLPPINVGSTIIVSNVSPARYNGTYVVVSSSNVGAYTVSFASSASGNIVSGGTVATNVDPITGLVRLTPQRVITEAGESIVNQSTGAPQGNLNETPGVPEGFPPELGGDDPGLPYGFVDIPSTGPLE